MKRLVICMFIFFATVSICSSVFAENCSVEDDYTQDSAGLHYQVFNSSGEYIGYVTLLQDTESQWVVWLEGEGSPNDILPDKESAVDFLCQKALEKEE